MSFKYMMAAAVLCVSSVSAQAGTISVTTDLGGGISGSFNVEERMAAFNRGVYNVTNGTNGRISAFGVSNNFTLPQLYDLDGSASNFECRGGDGCYSGRAVDSGNWGEIAYTDYVEGTGGSVTEVDYSFQDLFGDFATVAGGDNVFNWFYEVDGSMGPDASYDNWFGFSGLVPASSIIGLALNNTGGATAFTAGMATVPGPSGPGVSPVPLPAAGWLMIAGMGGLFAARRRRKA